MIFRNAIFSIEHKTLPTSTSTITTLIAKGTNKTTEKTTAVKSDEKTERTDPTTIRAYEPTAASKKNGKVTGLVLTFEKLCYEITNIFQ